MTDILFIVKDKDVDNIQKQVRGIYLTADNTSSIINTTTPFKSKVIRIKSGAFLDSVIKEHHPKIVIIETPWISKDRIKLILEQNAFIEKIIVRVHSDFSFYALESRGIIILKELSELQKVYIAGNCENFIYGLTGILNKDPLYLPNTYIEDFNFNKKNPENFISVGIFGSVRLLKNHLVQAIAAVKYSTLVGKKLKLYINNLHSDLGRIIIDNISSLKSENVEIIKFPYKTGSDYKNLIQSLDVGMQLSFSETFNNVAADFVSNGVPIIYGDQISWLNTELKTSNTEVKQIEAIINKGVQLRNNEEFLKKQYQNLVSYNKVATEHWLKFLLKNK